MKKKNKNSVYTYISLKDQLSALRNATTFKKRKEKLTEVLKYFSVCYPWEQLEIALGKREYKKFCKWMTGQTCPMGGVYPSDFERYLLGLPVID